MPELGLDAADETSHLRALMASEIVHDDDVAGSKLRQQHLADIEAEAFPIDRTIKETRGGEPIGTQRAQEGECVPAPVWSITLQSIAARAPAAQGRHVGLHPGLIEKDEPIWIEPGLQHAPALAASRHVGARLFGGEQSFF